jgi:hypothetical protein
VAKGPKPRSGLFAASAPVLGALIAFIVATSQAYAEATKAAQPIACGPFGQIGEAREDTNTV